MRLRSAIRHALRPFVLASSLALSSCSSGDSSGSGGDATRCHSTAGYESDSTCTEHFEKCDNQKIYDVACTGSSGAWACQCKVDGNEIKAVESSDYCDLEDSERENAANPLCGWNLR